MTGKPHLHPFFPEDRLLERKGDHHSPREAGQFLGPPCPPRPKLRGNVVDHGDPPLVHLFPHPVVEIGKIDEEERAHVGARCPSHRGAQCPDDRRQVTGPLGHSDHGDLPVIQQEPHPLARQARAPDPLHRNPGIPLSERLSDPNRVRFPGGLPADEKQDLRRGAQRLLIFRMMRNASSSAASPSDPATNGCAPVPEQSTKERISSRRASTFSVSRSSPVISGCPSGPPGNVLRKIWMVFSTKSIDT